MNHLSAAARVPAGAIPFIAGAFTHHNPTQRGVTLAGAVVALYGLIAWTRLLPLPEDKSE